MDSDGFPVVILWDFQWWWKNRRFLWEIIVKVPTCKKKLSSEALDLNILILIMLYFNYLVKISSYVFII